MQVFYVNIGGGEPTVRKDFWELVEYATAHHVGVKFSTNGSRIDADRAAWVRASDYVDVQISLDGATAEVNDRVRGVGSYATAMNALSLLAGTGAKLSVVVTRENAGQLDAFKAIADEFEATLRLTRLRPSGRGADVWDELHPTQEQQRAVYEWLLAHGEEVLTGDSFFHLAAYGQTLPGLNLCGAGRVVCLIDPIGDVYACPFAIHETFLAGNVREAGFAPVWRESELFQSTARAAGGGRVRIVQHVRRVPRRLHGGEVLHRAAAERARPGVRVRARRAGAARRAARSRRRITRSSRSRAARVTSRRSDGVVRVGRGGAAAGSTHVAALRLQGDPRRGGARADLPGQPRRVRGARLRAARRGRVRGAGAGDLGDGRVGSTCPCCSRPPASRPCTRRPSARSRGPRRRAARRWG